MFNEVFSDKNLLELIRDGVQTKTIEEKEDLKIALHCQLILDLRRLIEIQPTIL